MFGFLQPSRDRGLLRTLHGSCGRGHPFAPALAPWDGEQRYWFFGLGRLPKAGRARSPCSQHLPVFTFVRPCRSICEPKQKGESDGSCRFHIQRLFFPTPFPLSVSICLPPAAHGSGSRGGVTSKLRISCESTGEYRERRGIVEEPFTSALIDRSEGFRGSGNYTTHPLVTIY